MKTIAVKKLHRQLWENEGDYTSTKDMFNRILKYMPDNKLLAELDSKKNIIYHTTQDVVRDIESLGDGLINMGLEGKHIAISAENSYLYIICDLCIAGGVGVVTPIDKDAPDELLVTLLNKCDADAIICSSYLIEKVKRVQEQCPRLKTIMTIDKEVEGYPYIRNIIKKGYELGTNLYRNKEIDVDEPAKILFTSGTTGANKGVVLTQRNLAANIMNGMNSMEATKGMVDTSMSVLPMHHATEINTHILMRLACGNLTYINDNMKNMMNNIKIFQPTVITIVPMIANAFYHQIWANAKKAGKAEKLKKGIKLCKLTEKFGVDITHKLFKEVYAPFGGNLRQIIVGGAMLNPEVVAGLRDLGIYMVNGYGITECGPLVSMNTDTLHEVYSVGKACPGLSVKVYNADENGIGELCIKGASVMKEYYKDAEATKKTFTEDGYFNTGDLVTIDSTGRIFMSGRKKNAIVLENGKNIYPEEIEREIEHAMPYCKDVVVYVGECDTQNGSQNLLSVGLYIEDEEIRANKEKIKQDIIKVNKILPNYKQIHYINLVDSEYEKTSTRKIKRIMVSSKHDSSNGIRI